MSRHLSLPILAAAALAGPLAASPAGAASAVQDGVAAQPGEQQDQDQDQALHAFQIYNTQAARALVESAEEHLAASRWSEALVDLQALLEEHHGEVLGASRPRASQGLQASLHDVHRGAADWATGTLYGLDPEARTLYQERYGERAARALAAAIGAGDRAALAAVARRWPITAEAVRAWWALGDLELELGNVDVGLSAWARALALELGARELAPTRPARWRAALDELESGSGARPGVRERVSFALARLEDGGDDLGLAVEPPSGTALAGGGEYGKLGPAPDTWPSPHKLGNGRTNPFQQPRGRYALYPVRHGDTVFYSTTRSVHAVGAYTGETVWSTPENMLGWQDVSGDALRDFEDAVAFDDSLVVPAASQGVVVAPLQIPLVFEDKDSYGDLKIIKIVPERRLFAFDAATGERLWDTVPPPVWDGESGSFEHRMTVVGPPTITGSRLVVPAAMLRGRIELHVGCYDLHTGELLWSTPLVTGQRPLNMFGRLVEEYTAPPVVVAGDRVVVQTQLGTVACLDLFTGETRWQTLYDQIPITPGNYYNDGELHKVWQNSPAALIDEVVVCAPFDGEALVGLDLETGAVLWTVGHAEINHLVGEGLNPVVDTLVGADDRHVFLAGRKVVAFEAPGGLAHEAPRRRDWVYPSDRLSGRVPRPVLTKSRVYVPGRAELDVIDRRNGMKLDAIHWNPTPGNLLVGEGMLFTLSDLHLNGFFEWESMVRRARARVAEVPEDLRAADTLAMLLYKRGVSAMQAADYKPAARFLEDARTELERFAGSEGGVPPMLRESLHLILRAEARNLRLAADPRTALRRLREARPLAASRESRRDTLLEEQAVLRGRDVAGWLEVMELLERDYGDLPVAVLADPGEAGGAGWQGQLNPRVASLATPGPEAEEAGGGELPVGLWVLIERSQEYARRGRPGDGALALADLHAILERYGREPLFEGAAWDWAAERIGDELARGSEGYAPFEKRAGELLDTALRERDLAVLERVPLLFPHSDAANRSNDARIELSLGTGDVDRVAEIVMGELPDFWHPRDADGRQVRHLLRLADALGERGNLELRSAVARTLASHHPDLVPELTPGDGRRLAELAEAWRAPDRAPSAAASATFGASLELARDYHSISPLLPVGEVPPAPGQGDRVALYCDGSRLYAFSEASVPETTWRAYFDTPRAGGRDGDPLPSDYEGSIQTSPGRVHVATQSRVVAYDRETGNELWSWPSGGRGLYALDVRDGVVVAREDARDDAPDQTFRLIGFDACSGVLLWEISVLRSKFHARPVLGEGALVLLPTTSGSAQVFDLFTGRATSSFELAFSTSRTANAAWIENGRVILPNFGMGMRPQRNDVQAFDLMTGERGWRVPLAEGPQGDRELTEVFSWDGRHYLYLWPVRPGSQGAPRPGIFELNTALGALATRPVAELDEDSEIIGVSVRQRTDLQTPYLFALVLPTRGDDRFWIHAIHVRYGLRWKSPLPREFVRTPGSDMPLPAVSESTVALAYKQPGGASRGEAQGRLTELLLLDRSSGRQVERREMSEEMWSTTAGVRFGALGDALFVCGAKKMEILQ